jgi:hypothetical protein
MRGARGEEPYLEEKDVEKKIKKLVLNKETLKTLDPATLQKAAGGATGVSDCFQCSQYWTQCFCSLE